MQKIETLKIEGLSVKGEGQSSTGRPWVLYGVEASFADGTPITDELVSFDKMPTDSLVEVETERRDDPKYGVSYKLKPTEFNLSPAEAQLALEGTVKRQTEQISELQDRVSLLEAAHKLPTTA
jgi:hypothetical protein